jgi:hypothetical protein
VNCNGTGQFNRIVTSAGISTAQVDDFIITSAVKVYSGSSFAMIATSMVDASQVPSAIVAGGIFLTRVHTRLPDPTF